MTANRVKFATQIDSDLLREVKSLAKSEGRQIQALVEEGLGMMLENHRQASARPHVMAAYQKTHARFAPLYKKLAE